MQYIAYIITAASVIGTVANSFGKRWCFIVWGITNTFWIAYNISINSYAQAMLYAFNLLMAIVGFIKWRGKTRKNYTKAVKQINTALKISLKKWQINYIFRDGNYHSQLSHGRCNGKTLANVIKLCLSEGEPMIFRRNAECPCEHFCEYAKEDTTTPARRRYFVQETIRIYTKLEAETDLPLRQIIFR